MTENFTTSPEPFEVRRIEARDREAVLALWHAYVAHSQQRPETVDALAVSIESAIAGKYHMWVAEAFGQIIGSASVIFTNASLAHLRYLHLDPNLVEQQIVARGLIERAIRDVWEQGYLKLVIHTSWPPSQLSAYLHDRGFEFSREHAKDGEHVLEFYLNLYERPRP